MLDRDLEPGTLVRTRVDSVIVQYDYGAHVWNLEEPLTGVFLGNREQLPDHLEKRPRILVNGRVVTSFAGEWEVVQTD